MAIDAAFTDKQVLAAQKITEALAVLAPIQSFSKRIDATEKGSVLVKFPKGSGSLEFDSEDYTGGSANLDKVLVPVREVSHKFELTGLNANDGITLADIDTAELGTFLSLVVKEVTDVIVSPAFTASAVDSSSLTKADMNTLFVETKGLNKVCLLDAASYATVAPADQNGFSLTGGAFGFNKVSFVGNLDASIQGAALGENAIAIATGQNTAKWAKLASKEDHLMISTPIGNVLYRQWVSSDTGISRGCFVMLFGAIAADTGSSVILTDLA